MRVPRHRSFLAGVVVVVGCGGFLTSAYGQQKKSKADLERDACGPPNIKHEVRIVGRGDADVESAPDRAVVYVVRPEIFGNAIQTKLSVDGKWVGVNLGRTYFSMTLEAGVHQLCSEAGNRDVQTLTVEAGKTYYLEQRPVTNVLGKMKNSLDRLDEKEGQRAVKLCRRSMAVQKGS